MLFRSLRLANENKRLRWVKEQTLVRKIGKKCYGQTNLKFEVFGSERRTVVRCRKNVMMLEECLTPSVKHVGGNVMVWGCFGGGRVGDLYRV